MKLILTYPKKTSICRCLIIIWQKVDFPLDKQILLLVPRNVLLYV